MTFQILWISLSFLIFTAAVFFLVPFFLINLPVDYFSEKLYIRVYKKPKSPIHFLFILIKTILGIILIVIGIVLLFIPGQGLLTIFTGLMLIKFPGKRRLELYIVRKNTILRAINWIRARAGKDKIVKIYGKE